MLIFAFLVVSEVVKVVSLSGSPLRRLRPCLLSHRFNLPVSIIIGRRRLRQLRSCAATIKESALYFRCADCFNLCAAAASNTRQSQLAAPCVVLCASVVGCPFSVASHRQFFRAGSCCGRLSKVVSSSALPGVSLLSSGQPLLSDPGRVVPLVCPFPFVPGIPAGRFRVPPRVHHVDAAISACPSLSAHPLARSARCASRINGLAAAASVFASAAFSCLAVCLPSGIYCRLSWLTPGQARYAFSWLVAFCC